MIKKNSMNLRLQELMVFDAILSNGSITAASEALGVTQSSVSKQLKNLRESFGDELFVRSGRGMAATSKALALAPQVADLISSLEALHGEIEFNPRDIARNFVISSTDEIHHLLVPSLVDRIADASPDSRIVFHALDRDYAAKKLESGAVDLAITLNWHVPEHLKQRRLFSDDFVVICRNDHPVLEKRLTLRRYLEASHMMVSPLGTAVGPVDEALAGLGHRRSVRLSVPYFMQVADALLNSDMLLTLQRRACQALVQQFPLTIVDTPVNLQPVHYYMFWHKRYDKDSTNQWLRKLCYEQLCEIADRS